MQCIPQSRKRRVSFFYQNFLVFIALVLFCGTSFSQQKLTDSLIRIKTNYERHPDFKFTDTSYIKNLYELARSYIYQIPDSTKSIAERVLEFSKKENFKEGIAGGNLGLGLYYNITGEFDKGFDYLTTAESNLTQTNDYSLLMKVINSKAMNKFMKGDFPEAYLECKKGEELADQIGDLEMQVFFAMNLATCFAILNDYDQALPYYQRALTIVEESKDFVQKAQIESNLGYLHLHNNEFEKAKAYCTNAIITLSEEKLQAWESFAWATLGEVAIREKQYETALEHFTKSDDLLSAIEDMQRKAETAQGFAVTYFHKEDFDKSLEYAQSAEKISKDINYHQGVVNSSELLYKLYVEKNEHKKALEYLEVANRLSDSILESENKAKFLMLDTQAQFDQDKELANFENEKKIAKQKTITYSSVIVLIALLLILSLIAKNAQNQKKANTALKGLNESKDKLFSIIGHDLRAPVSTLQELLELYTSKEISEKEVATLAPKLKQNLDHSSFTLSNLLYWAKTQMSDLSPELQTIPLKENIRSVCSIYENEIKDKNLDFQCRIDEEARLKIDPSYFGMILQNVISNAIKYSYKGGVITFNCEEKNSEFVEIKICDSGVGMKPSTIEAINNNETVNTTVGTQQETGTGIGLQVVQNLIKIHNGIVEIQSKPNKGTCVVLKFNKAS